MNSPRVLSECSSCGATVFVPPAGERPVPMDHVAGCPAVDQQACVWCGGPMGESPDPRARTCQGRCKAARWKWETGYGHHARPVASQVRTNRRLGGAQLSFRKTVYHLADELLVLDGLPLEKSDAQRMAAELLAPCLPERQRDRLERDYPDVSRTAA
jgi:hypothetical protein